MIKANQDQIVTVDGLQFKKYQTQFMESWTKLEGYDKLQEWMRDTLLLNLIVKLEAYGQNYASEYIERLRQEGYSRQ